MAATGGAAEAKSISDADVAAGIIDRVAPATSVIPPTESGGMLVAETDRHTVTVLTAEGGDVVLTPVQGRSLTMRLPETGTATVAEVASDGTIVFDSTSAVDVAVQATSDGLRAQTVISDHADSNQRPVGPVSI